MEVDKMQMLKHIFNQSFLLYDKQQLSDIDNEIILLRQIINKHSTLDHSSISIIQTLIYLAKQREYHLFIYVLKHAPKLNTNSLLYWIIKYEYTDVLYILMDPNQNISNARKFNVNKILLEACKQNKYNIIQFLLQRKDVRIGYKQNEFFWIAINHDNYKLFKMLYNHPQADPSDYKCCIFIAACELKRTKIVQLLLKDPRIRQNLTIQQNSALFEACKYNSLNIVNQLLKFDSVRKGPNLYRCIQIITQKRYPECELQNQLNITKLLLTKTNVDPSKYHNEILAYCIEYQFYPMINILLSYNTQCDPSIRNNKLLYYICSDRQCLLLYPNLLTKVFNDSRVNPTAGNFRALFSIFMYKIEEYQDKMLTIQSFLNHSKVKAKYLQLLSVLCQKRKLFYTSSLTHALHAIHYCIQYILSEKFACQNNICNKKIIKSKHGSYNKILNRVVLAKHTLLQTIFTAKQYKLPLHIIYSIENFAYGDLYNALSNSNKRKSLYLVSKENKENKKNKKNKK